MPTLDVTNWTSVLVALSPLLIALLRRDSMNDNQVAALAVGILAICFFAGRALDGALSWPMNPSLAAEFAASLVGQQALYQLLRKTTVVEALERTGNGHP
jgi:hypothetical protein